MQKVIVIAGPTGIGKTRLALTLAKHLQGEIINADSMQVYKELKIGTAKIEDQEQIRHHLISIRSVRDPYNVYEYQKEGRHIMAEIIKRGKVPIIVGGTGLYIKALLYDYKFQPRTKVIDNNHFTNEELLAAIKEFEPNVNVHVNNRQRLLSLLARYQTGEIVKKAELCYDAIFIGLTMPRDRLYLCVNERVELMLKQGLVEEVRGLYEAGIKNRVLLSAIGYKELYQYFDGVLSYEESIALIKRNTRRYVKRQYTWFKHQLKLEWFVVDPKCFKKTEVIVKEYIEKLLIN